LNKYEPGTKEFKYNASESLGNLLAGENHYLVEVIDETDELIIRKFFKIVSTKKSIPAQVEELFGEISLTEGGWYVSSKLPWFSFREVYEELNYKKDDGNIVLPRPTLKYTVEAEADTDLCDYLAAIDFEEEGVIYRSFSYETCQKYRYGVTVYDRFLTVLESEPVKTIRKEEYNDLKDQVSSAFVMIETGGMGSQIDADLSDSTDEENMEEDPSYFVFQMLITEGVAYDEEVIGDIEVEADAERAATIQKIRALLSGNSGEEVFGKILED